MRGDDRDSPGRRLAWQLADGASPDELVRMGEALREATALAGRDLDFDEVLAVTVLACDIPLTPQAFTRRQPKDRW